MRLLLRWLLSTVAILVAAYVLPGVAVEGFFTALFVAVVLGLLNALLRPLLILLTLPVNILTFGLFTLVINALLVMLTAALVRGFAVRSFWWAMAFSVVLWLVNMVLQSARE